jgi:hypothetical protein
MPFLPTNCDLPPTLKSLMNSICNYGKEEKTNIYNLAKGSRSTIFNFDYPLSDKVNKEDFEVMILNHFIHRRIGFDTPTEFRIAKLNIGVMRLWENLLKSEAQEVPIKAEKIKVAREIFKEIEDIRLEHSYGEIDGNELNVKLFNLKKKYESEGEG